MSDEETKEEVERLTTLEIGVDAENEQVVLDLLVQSPDLSDVGGSIKVRFHYEQDELKRFALTLIRAGEELWGAKRRRSEIVIPSKA